MIPGDSINIWDSDIEEKAQVNCVMTGFTHEDTYPKYIYSVSKKGITAKYNTFSGRMCRDYSQVSGS